MLLSDRMRGLLALAAAAGVALMAFTAPAGGPALAGIAAGIAVWLALRPPGEAPAPPPPPAQPPGPSFAESVAALDEPILLVERRIVTQANPAAQRLLGEHIVGEDVRLAIRHPAAADTLADAAGGGSPVDLVGLGDGLQQWELSVHRIGSGTSLIRLADRSQARAAERMRVDFVANASHELRTPLATLLGFIETLEDANGPGDAATRLRFLGIMLAEARRMQRLVDDLMSLSRIEADRASAPQQAVDLASLIELVRGDLPGENAADRARIAFNADGVVPPVAGDRAQLSQLLHNLVGNALRYGRPGTPIGIRLEQRDSMVCLSVEDQGEGIAREHLPRLTERFYRVDPGRSRALGGTGLGLAIVKHIVERHRGRLEIASTVGVGTTVSVLLPVAASCHQSVIETSHRPSGGDAGKS